MNLVLLLLFSWVIFFFIFHRYHSGSYYSPEGYQNPNPNPNPNPNTNPNPDQGSVIDGMVEMNNQKQVEKEIVEKAQQLDAGNQGDATGAAAAGNVSNDIRELSGAGRDPANNVRSSILSNEIVEQEPDVKNCLYVPRGHSVQSCIDRCHNREDRKYWGGDNCTNKNCTKICTGCKDKDLCQWITSENVYKEVTVPNPPPKQEITVIEGNASALILWSTIENNGQPNKAFLVKYFKTYKPFEGVKMASVVVEDENTKNFSYQLENLDNNEYYSVGVMAVNETDVGPISNVEQVSPNETKKIMTNF
jgi:hypothetical protein